MAVGGLFRYAQRALFAPPTPDRQLLRLTKGHSIRRVVELGLEDVATTKRLLEQLVKNAGGETVSYTVIDLFEQRGQGVPQLRLADAYRELRPTDVRMRVAPGSISSGLANEANALGDTDLLLLAQHATDDAIGAAWFYIPRMCHPGTVVLRRESFDPAAPAEAWTPIPLAEIARKSAASGRLAA